MTVIGLDDTDSRDRGMCTTYVAAVIAAAITEEATVHRILLVRLNPGVPHKTRGNAALAIHTDLPVDRAMTIAHDRVAATAETADPNTHPGLVITAAAPDRLPEDVSAFARTAVRDFHTIAAARELIDAHGYESAHWKDGRGRIGALAAIGAWAAFDEWTHEYITYRTPDQWGTPRSVDPNSVIAAADAAYPDAWDTVDRTTEEPVCVPRTPGPVLYGIRGDDQATVRSVAKSIDSEPVDMAQLFVTNQGTDAHLRPAPDTPLQHGRSYRVTGTITDDPETCRGGHVFFPFRTNDTTIQCAAFEPTKRFRDWVRALRRGDRITACGEVTDRTLKLEKFAVRDLRRTELVVPLCPECDRSMDSAGADQGYRCRDCGTTAPGKVERVVDRTIEQGWYEVPPRARRHIAKPLIRGGFDAPVHPER